MAEEEVLYHPDECLECRHFCCNTWTARNKGAPVYSYCFGFGERRKVNMDRASSEPCPKKEPRGGGNIFY